MGNHNFLPIVSSTLCFLSCLLALPLRTISKVHTVHTLLSENCWPRFLQGRAHAVGCAGPCQYYRALRFVSLLVPRAQSTPRIQHKTLEYHSPFLQADKTDSPGRGTKTALAELLIDICTKRHPLALAPPDAAISRLTIMRGNCFQAPLDEWVKSQLRCTANRGWWSARWRRPCGRTAAGMRILHVRLPWGKSG